MTNTGPDEPRVFGQRYEIQSKIARGGMADVFLARDQLLDRPVALKVLFPELSVDPNFVQRFRREAQNAAKLSHPNIVSVFDWGEEGNTYYIVMEYVDGKSLSVLLREQGSVEPVQAAKIGAEVASALAFAHHHGVVHRDVKPGNVLLDDRGGVKVTDFGIARARNTTENLTQTGAVMGTATYFSPEQAQGLNVDQRSDVYSLGVVLYELVAGRPPFQGDNPVAIAYKHVREQPTPLRRINPATPAAYEAVVAEAMAKSPANRYPSAGDLRADLERFSSGAPVRATAIAPPLDATQAVPFRSPEDAYAESVRAIPAAPPRPPTPLPKLPSDKRGGVAGPLLVLVGLLALLGLAAIVLFTNNSLTGGADPRPLPVPNVTGRSLADAQAALAAVELESSINREASDAPVNQVVRQDPGAGATVHEGDTIRLTVSDGPDPVTIPSVSGQSADDARRALQRLGFNVATTQAPSESVDEGDVISQEPTAGSSLPKGQTVTLTVSTGRQRVEVPDVVNYTQAAAAQLITEAGLRSTFTNRPSSEPAGNVIATDPKAGTEVAKDSVVTIVVSNGQGTTSTSSVVTIVIPSPATRQKND